MIDDEYGAGNPLLDRICVVIAIHEPFSIDEIVEVYKILESIDELLAVIQKAKEENCSLLDAMAMGDSSLPDSTNVKRVEIKDVDDHFRKQWLKKRQRGMGVRKINFRFGQD
jgi:hypothetical protein